jgi:two-component system chemotaxis response regulator CheB
VVALAASAGGLTALGKVLGALPAAFPVPILVLEHLLPEHRSVLAEILARRTPLRVKQVEDGETMHAGTAYIAPPDAHTVVRAGGTVHLETGPPVRFVRPSADLLFDSVANVYGPRALVVVLTGTGRDGAAGVTAVKEAGGAVFAQDEATSEHWGMPRAAIETGAVDRVLPLEEIPEAISGMIAVGETS